MIRTLCFISLLLASISMQAQETYFSKEKLEEDIKQLEKTLVGIHPGLDYFTPKSDIESMFQKRLATLPDSMSRIAFYELLEPIIDTIKCGHTNIQFSHKLYKEKEDREKPQLFPMDLVMLNNEVLVEKDFDIGEHIIPKGSQILSIDSVDVNYIVDRLALYHKGADGDNHYPERLWAVKGFKGGYARFFGLKDKFVVSLINSKNQEKQIYTLDAVPPNALSEIKKAEKKATSPVTLSVVDNGQIGLLRISSFSDQGNFKKSKKKFRKAFKEIREKNLNKVIIDVRDNGGGAISNIKHLTRYLLDKDYLIIKKATIEEDFKDEKKSWFQNLMFFFNKKELVGDEYVLSRFSKKKIKPRKNLYTGDLVVLINERSYSAAALTPAILRDRNRATLIGEEAGGSYHLAFAGSSKYVRLKNSKIKVRVPIIQLIYDVQEDHQDRRKGLLPDIYKTYTKEDLTNGTDAVLEYAIEYLDQKKTD